MKLMHQYKRIPREFILLEPTNKATEEAEAFLLIIDETDGVTSCEYDALPVVKVDQIGKGQIMLGLPYFNWKSRYDGLISGKLVQLCYKNNSLGVRRVVSRWDNLEVESLLSSTKQIKLPTNISPKWVVKFYQTEEPPIWVGLEALVDVVNAILALQSSGVYCISEMPLSQISAFFLTELCEWLLNEIGPESDCDYSKKHLTVNEIKYLSHLIQNYPYPEELSSGYINELTTLKPLAYDVSLTWGW